LFIIFQVILLKDNPAIRPKQKRIPHNGEVTVQFLKYCLRLCDRTFLGIWNDDEVDACCLLLHQPLEIDEFVAELKNAGIRIASKDVVDFLDEQVMNIILFCA